MGDENAGYSSSHRGIERHSFFGSPHTGFNIERGCTHMTVGSDPTVSRPMLGHCAHAMFLRTVFLHTA